MSITKNEIEKHKHERNRLGADGYIPEIRKAADAVTLFAACCHSDWIKIPEAERKNASVLFKLAIPLEYPEATDEQLDTIVTRYLNTMRTTLSRKRSELKASGKKPLAFKMIKHKHERHIKGQHVILYLHYTENDVKNNIARIPILESL